MLEPTEKNAAIAVYDSHSDAEEAIRELERGGFDMKKLSIVGKDYRTEEHPVGFYNMGDRVKAWGKTGAFWGGLWGLLLGWAFFFIPGIGPLMIAGPLVSWLIAALEGAVAVGGLSAIGAALYSFGIPKNSVIQYETAIKAGKFVVIAHGTTKEVERAKNILDSAGHTGVEVYAGEEKAAKA
jgi:hypothetical protein